MLQQGDLFAGFGSRGGAQLGRWSCWLGVLALLGSAPGCGEDAPAPPSVAVDPGNVPIRRLSNEEYNRTVRDLAGEPSLPAQAFPADVPAYGFDNVSSAQVLSTAHFDAYRRAAQAIAAATLLVPEPIALRLEAEDLSAYSYMGSPFKPSWGGPTDEYFHFQYMRGYVTSGLRHFPYDGSYTIAVRARGLDADHLVDGQLIAAGVAPEMRIELSGADLATFPVHGAPGGGWGQWQTYLVTTPVKAGAETVRVWLANAKWSAGEQRNVQLDVDWIEVAGPEAADLPAPDQARIDRFLSCNDGSPECIDGVVSNALTLLWRRPASVGEIARYRGLFREATDRGDDFRGALELVIQGALLSPNFLFRPELDPIPGDPAPHPLAGHELASRLSYFLWSSAPDAELLARAEKGGLRSDDGLLEQVDRMLADPRADALSDNFAAQWLHLRQMEEMTPSREAFPEFDDGLRSAMVEEIRRLFRVFLEEDRSVLDVVDTEFTFVDRALASHYGLPVPSGDGFHRVDVRGLPRGGLLTSAGWLTLTSHPAKTSPTRRGKWLLEQLLCRAPPDPPPDVDTTLEPAPDGASSLKEMLAEHAENPGCAPCHVEMDALGLTLERFDPIGRWRDADDFGMPVDASATLPSGQMLEGHEDLAASLRGDPGFERCIVEKMLVYALGRDPRSIDPRGREMVRTRFSASGHRLRALIDAVVLSPMFRQRRADASASGE